ncbi:HAD family hydrolase [Amylibacter sp.]|nr:HAD family hydrolase [Amylibacter sp.]MDB4095672.1 HAD family hydrolase [Amylibacter sp.]
MDEILKLNFSQINLNQIEGVLLDLDDTLYCYARCHDIALMSCFNKYSFKNTFSEFKLRYRAARNSVTAQLKPQGASRSRLFAFMLMAEESGIKFSYSLAYELDEVYWSTFIESMYIDADAFAFLKSCKKLDIPTCIVTDMTAHVQIRKIRRLGIEDYITHFVSSEEVGAEKPDPRMFTTAVNKLGISSDKCIMIGDNYEKDVVGATKTGIKAHLICLNSIR